MILVFEKRFPFDCILGDSISGKGDHGRKDHLRLNQSSLFFKNQPKNLPAAAFLSIHAETSVEEPICPSK